MQELLRLKLQFLHFILTLATGYMRNFVANIAKRMIGKTIYWSEKDVFFQHYVEYVLGVRPGLKITSRGWSEEGFGSQARLTMLAINFARVSGLPYVHTPFTEISHRDRPMELWVKAWEEEFNLGAGEVPAEPNDDEVIDFAQLFFLVRSAFLYTAFNITRKEFRQKYYLNKAPRINPQLIVGIHVRRGDVSTGHPMWTELTSISTTIIQLKNILERRKVKYRIKLFSDGTCSEFVELKSIGVELVSNRDALWTMRELIEADVLVMAKSLFSYVAALISDGVKLYEPWSGFWIYPPLEGWLIRSPEGAFDERLFEIRLGG